MTNGNSFGVRFGNLVKREREKRGWSQAKLAYEAWGNGDRNFDTESRAPQIRRIEDGSSPKPQAKTIKALKDALKLKQKEIEALRFGEETEHPELVAVLMERNRALSQSLKLQDEALIAVAKAHADSAAENFDAALADVRAALIELARLKDAPDRTSNFGPQMATTLSELDDLVSKGQFASAQQRTDEEISRIDAEHAAYKSSLLERSITQARAMNDADAAAEYMLQRVALEPGAVGFETLNKVQNDWYEHGRDKGLSFDLEVANRLAERLHEIATNRYQRGAALHSQGLAVSDRALLDSNNQRFNTAATVFELAMQEWTRKKYPNYWAKSKMGLAVVYANLSERVQNPEELLRNSISMYREVLEVQVSVFWHHDRSMCLMNLGVALRRLGHGMGNSQYILEAIDAFEEALRLRQRQLVPIDWAITQMNLANTYSTLFDFNRDFGLLEKAVSSYRNVIDIFYQKNLIPRLVLVKMNLGVVLAKFGFFSRNVDKIDSAISIYHDALSYWTKDKFPFDWARTNENLTEALRSRYTISGQNVDLENAIAHQRLVLEFWQQTNVLGHIDEASSMLQMLLKLQSGKN